MFFNEATRKDGAGAGVIFVTPDGEVLRYAFSLIECCSNNMVEHQALVLGLEMALTLGIPSLQVICDSKLNIN